jgi:geranylgeranyl pyrophosphate synthase
VTARPRLQLPEPLRLQELFDRHLDDGDLAALVEDDHLLPSAGQVPRALWEAALLDPARDVLTRPSKQFRSRLVRMAARLAGARHLPAALPALLEMIHTGSLVVDDIQDDSSQRRGAACLHRLHGVPLALNTGNWLYFWPLTLLDTLGLPAALTARLRQRMCAAMFRCHFGQALDLALPVGQLGRTAVPAVVAAATRLKTGTLTALAAETGALAAEAPAAMVAALGRFGHRLGVALQMLDDLGNLAEGDDHDDKRHEDLRLGRPTWPWAWAAEQLDDRAFADLQREARVLNARALAGGRVDAGPLAARLRAAVGTRGRREASRLLDRAFDELRTTLGPDADLHALAAEIARLEAAYV